MFCSSSPWPTTGNPSQPPSQSDGGVLAQDLFMMESRGSQKQANGSSVSAATEAMGGMALVCVQSYAKNVLKVLASVSNV